MKNKIILSAAFLVFILIIFFLTLDIDDPVKIQIGQQAPAIEIANAADKKDLPLAYIKNKVLFINFWASWCQPCVIEMPSINRLANHFKNNSDFIVLTVIYRDDLENATSFIKNNNLDLPVMIDRNMKTAKSFGVTGVPETFIIDKNNVIRGKFIGPYVWDSPEMIKDISKTLQEQ